MSVVRTTTATRVNSAGLVELVPYNLLSYSEDFSNAAWVKSNATFSVDTLTGNAGTSFKGIFQNQTTQGFQSVFFDVAYSSHQWIQIAVGTTATDVGYVNFDIQNKVVGAQTGGFTGSIVDFGTYVRIIANINTIAKTSVLLCLVNSSSSSRAASTTSTGSIKLYRSQLVEGSVAKDYQKTETRLNIPRLDYSNGTCPSLLVEPQRTNLILQSSSFDNAAWSKVGGVTTTANTTTSPSGVQDADTINFSAYGQELNQFISYVPFSGTYTHSFWIKGTSGQKVNYYDGTGDTSITLTNEWTRVVITKTYSSQYLLMNFNSYGGWTATSPVYIWGAQLELGSYSTSYIPTTSASVTRNADVISKTGISSLIGQTEGTLFLDFEDYVELDIPCFTIDNGTNDNRIVLYRENGTGYLGLFLAASGTPVSALSTISASDGKIAIAYTGTTFVMYRNGVQILSITSAIPSSMSVVRFNGRATNDFYTTRKIKSFALWKTRLTNDELATLTTI